MQLYNYKRYGEQQMVRTRKWASHYSYYTKYKEEISDN